MGTEQSCLPSCVWLADSTIDAVLCYGDSGRFWRWPRLNFGRTDHLRTSANGDVESHLVVSSWNCDAMNSASGETGEHDAAFHSSLGERGCKCDVSSQVEQRVEVPDEIELEVLTIAGERATVLVRHDMLLADIVHLVEKSAKFGMLDRWPRLILGTEVYADICSQPLLGMKDKPASVTLVKQQCSEHLEFWFDSVDVDTWDVRFANIVGCCVLTIRVGSCARMNVTGWARLAEILRRHGHKVGGLSVRQVKGYLHPNAIRAISAIMPRTLQSLDVSRILPGAAGLELLCECLPATLQSMDITGCVDDGEACARHIIKALGGLRGLRRLNAAGNWNVEPRTLDNIRAAAPCYCEVILS
eukprot:gnl/TRDRNA2_/TRDRNA2_201040_c0_seq1.p1 gnl/TRDRNA2_/TRDRNA2_201040_c0~~gnl/TRDRNA2_/TRDRNA2_201040_c0_seq1.p1  ORF type:complete len:358 (-),score=24.03 gnl/TRDRNA2_/TRDRNA2_201040_c0_seq1:93-1166(-)